MPFTANSYPIVKILSFTAIISTTSLVHSEVMNCFSPYDCEILGPYFNPTHDVKDIIYGTNQYLQNVTINTDETFRATETIYAGREVNTGAA